LASLAYREELLGVYMRIGYREERYERRFRFRGRGGEQPVSKPTDLVQGTLDLLLLKILALEPLNGWAIGIRLKQVSGDVLQVSEGSLYPALHKLEHQGWITSEWRPTENNRRAKYYSLTPPGRAQLEKESADWNRLSSAISQVLRIEETGS
jgi:PadR family transcriptional regulator, regulatory protein PadR